MAAGTSIFMPTRMVVPTAVRTATVSAAVRASERVEAAAVTRATAPQKRESTISTWRLVRSPVAHQLAKCSQLSATGQ